MKIGNTPDITNAAATAANTARQATKPSEVAARGAERSAGVGVPVTLSPAARKADNLRSTPEFDAAKVSTIKSAIENGSFKVNAQAVADKMLANAHEVLSRVNPRHAN